jgi:uncharacterized protein (TIGR00725 family)
MGKRYITISVIGGHDITKNDQKLAYEVGKIIAQCGAVLVCGGLGGAMAAVAKGARDFGGLTIGLLPGTDKKDANPYIDIPLPTSLGYARNVIIACSADMIIALPGSYGTNSEICYGLVYHRPVIDLGNWNIAGMRKVKDLEGLAAEIKKLAKKKSVA